MGHKFYIEIGLNLHFLGASVIMSAAVRSQLQPHSICIKHFDNKWEKSSSKYAPKALVSKSTSEGAFRLRPLKTILALDV